MTDYTLPISRHIPGVNERPDCDLLERVSARAYQQTLSSTAATNPPWRYGIRLFNEGYYWEAHEVLEVVWMNAFPNSRERYLVQAIIHLTNASLKVRMQRENAARRLSALALESLRRAFATDDGFLMGLEYSLLVRIAQATGKPGLTIIETYR